MKRLRALVADAVEKFKHKRPKSYAASRHALLIFVGTSVLFASILVRKLAVSDLVSDPLNIVGVTLISVSFGFIIFEFIGGSPEAQEFRTISKENELGVSMGEQGILGAFETREAAKKEILKDLYNSRVSCRIYAAVYVGEVLHASEFVNIFERATRAASKHGDRYLLSYCSLDPSPRDDHGKSILEVWARKEGERGDSHRIGGRIEHGTDIFRAATSQVLALPGCDTLQIIRKYFTDYTCPHSMVVIDNKIVYVSLYDWSNTRGNHAPTLRLKSGKWAKIFVKEADRIDQKHSKAIECLPIEL